MKWVRGNPDGFLKMLTRIVSRFKGLVIDPWADSVSWRRGPGVNEILSEHTSSSIQYLPSYHPELDGQERLWRTLRHEETTDAYCGAMLHLDVAVFSRSQRWRSPKEKRLSNFLDAVS